MLRELRNAVSTGIHPPSAIELGRGFWGRQALFWGSFSVLGISLNPLTVGQTVYYVLFFATGAAVTGRMAALLRKQGLSHGPPRVLLRWSVREVILAALFAALIDILMDLFVRRVLAFERNAVVVEYAVTAAGWVLVLGAWLCAFCISEIMRATQGAIEAQRRMEASVQEAEARALRAQLDPHFLFNAINGARALISTNPDAARDMLSNYADILRYATTRGRGLTAVLDDELTAVKSYLEVERQRFPNQMAIHVDVPTSDREVRIPPMLLQTLAENAVRHGISRLRQGGTVAIVSELRGQTLLLHVTNPAPLPTAVSADSDPGIGLSNSRERLELLHGDAASLHVARMVDHDVAVEYWKVTVGLPFDRVTLEAPNV
ncbi:sensor histidine kinase [Gemmatimonas sp.]|uniref:sensor histidine kinase n=1 Tax=Gemmatimonas sp. TaxID=1962908 RepID=UPI003DA1DA27